MIRLGTLGRVGCLATAMAMLVASNGMATFVALAAVVSCAVLTSPRALRSVVDLRVAVFLVLLFVPAVFFVGVRDVSLAGVQVSREGAALGLQMAARALGMLIAIAAFAASLSIAEVTGLLERVGLRGLGFAVGVAINMLPLVTRTATTVYHALRLRGGFSRRRLRGLRLLLVTTVVSSLHHAEDVVAAAEARGFAAERVRRMPLAWSAADVLTVCTLLAVGAVLVFW